MMNNQELILDIFCGTKSMKPICEKLGYKYVGLDIEESFNPEICIDFLEWNYEEWARENSPSFIWISPDCSCYSMASGGRHFNRDHTTKTDKARLSLRLLDKVKEVINYFNVPFVVENPRARMRWFMNEYTRYTVSYCQYGFDRMKATDLWTSLKGFTPRMCHNGAPCHISAPRGSRTGTQGIPRSERYKVPPQLIEELLLLI